MRHPHPPLLAVALLLAGCATPPPEPLRTPEPPADSSAAPAAAARPLPRDWWTAFRDPELDRLIGLARMQNRDLAQASARIDAARARARIAGADEKLHLSGTGGATRQRTAENTVDQLGHNTATRFEGTLEFAYEVDLWGRLRSARLAAAKEVELAAAERAALEISLCAQVARHHLTRLATMREAAVVTQQIARYADSEALHAARVEAGFTTDLDVQRDRIEKANLEGELARLDQTDAAQAAALALLCGQAPTNAPGSLDAPQAVLPEVPDRLSLELLEARPDVAAQKNKWEAACLRVQTARAEFYPAVRLIGTLGTAAERPEDLFDWQSRLWSLVGNLTAPLLDGGRLKGNLELANAQLREAASGYEAAVLTAYREVADALNTLRTAARQKAAADAARESAARAVSLARERYEKGFATYLEVIDGERSLLDAQRTLVQVERERQIATVDLIRALGLP